MNREFSLKIFAADRVFYQGGCRSLVIPTVDGLFGIMAGHENMVIAVVPGQGAFTDGGGERRYAVVSSGICKIESNEVLVMVETAERPEEIEERLAQRVAADEREAARNRENVSGVKRAKAKMARAASGFHTERRNEID